MNYLIIKKDGIYFVQEVELLTIPDIDGYLTSTTHKADAYSAAQTLNYLKGNLHFSELQNYFEHDHN